MGPHRLRRVVTVLPAGLLLSAALAAPPDWPTFHRDPGRTGWNAGETELTREWVSGPQFGLVWDSEPLDAPGGEPPRLYASPLFVDELKLSAGPHAGRAFPVVIAATHHGFIYAISAFSVGDVPAGTILWRAALGTACRLEPVPLDGVSTGVLSTPVVDRARGRLYVTSCDQERRWQLHALDLASGAALPGWPVKLDEAAFDAPGVNANAGSARLDAARRSNYIVQRGALALSPDGARIYVTFGESATGWLVAVDTGRARIAGSFASVAEPHRNSGGIWGAGGPAVDANGDVFVVTGTGFSGLTDKAGDWTQSVLRLSYRDRFLLRGTYTPFNYCASATMDIDLGSGGALLLPDLGATGTATPRLMAVGGKQGNAYLIDRERMPGRLDRRQACSDDSSTDGSLLPPGAQPQFGRRGPLNVFGPYSERDAAMDTARGRSVAAYFRDAAGESHLFVTGSTRDRESSPVSVPPSLARLRVVAPRGEPAWLEVAALQRSLALQNPGSPVVSSNGGADAIVWVLDENARRSASLAGDGAPRPVLYAFDAMSLDLLWTSRAGELATSGKYNEPVIARGRVFVGTDRIQAFGRLPRAPDGAAIYRERCAACHDHPGGRVPPRELIALRDPEDIVGALTDGAMREQAAGLSLAEIRAVARYLH